MASLQVRDLPEGIYAKLSIQAELEHRSLAQEAVVVLERGLGVKQDSSLARRHLLEEIRGNSSGAGNKLPAPQDLVAEDRAR